MAASGSELKTAELTAIIREIQDRVRARYPMGDASGVPIPDLMPVVFARDAAEAKVAAIGTVNPRPPGFLNNIFQAVKRTVARALHWHIREQVEFNRAAMDCVEALLQALNETNRSLSVLSSRMRYATDEAAELKDVRTHWYAWRAEWEQKLTANETQFLRGVADLQAGFHHRAGVMELNFRDNLRQQHAGYQAALDRSINEIHKQVAEDFDRVRGEYERLIHAELHVLRQRMSTQSPAPASAATSAPASPPAPDQPRFDYLRFAERFRGGEDYVKRGQQFYLPHFQGRRAVLDIGCGRGEFLEMMRTAGVPARGIDLDQESVNLCRGKGLEAEVADLFVYLESLPGGSLDGIFCSQVVEHLPPAKLPEFIALAARTLSREGLIAMETPNPECLAIFATHFYLDPTHHRPVPAGLLSFYLEEAGFGRIHVERLAPAIESMPVLAELPEGFRAAFFGGLDYAILARRL